jgi:hypothetical protein
VKHLQDAQTITGLSKEIAVKALAATLAKSRPDPMAIARSIEKLIEAKVSHFRELSGLPPVRFHGPAPCQSCEIGQDPCRFCDVEPSRRRPKNDLGPSP